MDEGSAHIPNVHGEASFFHFFKRLVDRRVRKNLPLYSVNLPVNLMAKSPVFEVFPLVPLRLFR